MTLEEVAEFIALRSKEVLDVKPKIIFSSGTENKGSLSISNTLLKKYLTIGENDIEQEVDALLKKCKKWFGK